MKSCLRGAYWVLGGLAVSHLLTPSTRSSKDKSTGKDQPPGRVSLLGSGNDWWVGWGGGAWFEYACLHLTLTESCISPKGRGVYLLTPEAGSEEIVCTPHCTMGLQSLIPGIAFTPSLKRALAL